MNPNKQICPAYDTIFYTLIKIKTYFVIYSFWWASSVMLWYIIIWTQSDSCSLLDLFVYLFLFNTELQHSQKLILSCIYMSKLFWGILAYTRIKYFLIRWKWSRHSLYQLIICCKSETTKNWWRINSTCSFPQDYKGGTARCVTRGQRWWVWIQGSCGWFYLQEPGYPLFLQGWVASGK